MAGEEIGILTALETSDDLPEIVYNVSTYGAAESWESEYDLSSETMRLLFITIASISVLACLSICLSVFICVCLNRRRNLKRQDQKDHLLLPEQSEKINAKPNPSSHPKSNNESMNGKQTVVFKTSSVTIQPAPSSSSSATATTVINIRPTTSSAVPTTATTVQPYYYDNVDDIPYIDESRPTSFIELARV